MSTVQDARKLPREVLNRMMGAPGYTAPLQENYEWQNQAACRKVDPELFYYPDSERGAARKRRETAAKKVCASCPVLAVCARFALENVEVYGIWGGLTEKERQRAMNRRFRR